MPRTLVEGLQPGSAVSKQQFLLRDKSLTATRSGASLLRVVLGDRTGSLPGIWFDAPPRLFQDLVIGKGVEVTGKVEEYRDALQIRLERMTVTELADLSDFLPSARRPIGEMQRELDALIESVQQADLKRLLVTLLGNGASARPVFREAPAAKKLHHACRGGLLEHTLSVARLAEAACAAHAELSRDMVVTLAILHDLGKLRAYDPTTFELTDEGALWGHLYISASLVQAALADMEGFDPQLRLRIIHGILSHHGKLEHGSPVLPMTPEAMAVHHADAMDADLQGAAEAFGRPDAQSGAYTGFSQMHETRLYRGVGEDAEGYAWSETD
ncbi:MAG: 3'-5' exoribonuclease YhaM family protein [Anaerolineae bacterium]